ncbi:bifunctional UDP-3-O-[3-hydroxymyristoyl] N-acetylglucosamine deacetylase/3-hydroxyacyl-ACP dehydratase [Pelagicoccus sp. SDUM812003]|uniref:bifunctional UDP-3-O-[3-hydroxymyristoyl] N-acetylglucosamine deacetylase/3-hydroxyacyl-ACP dehydratase n=1 Tax=Pelagicoccus sp. SDUM812003 TaxID=3041267 RepID=UPI00280F8B32|nr:bifunctional UDP-3-O-[3-hydroxymyristoyl] N-acetylglucosamine deacetylase/3-hydroxyacyl-ACP dehydratase [Pelagicoccus sp. SDUM812003]MDQ8204393.1 bifunctional UDP-3-O-[3-hydroxymyristoyl] N-acetylglucosamine deacetylase/3-hydroxyacyl-ACP dehydratase [Pelagicoccus sp. SDUM812003]
MKQRSLLREVSIKGSSLHTGDKVQLTLKPAPANSGISIRRVDLHDKPVIKPHISQVTDLVRATTLTSGHAKVHTVEHILAALHGMGIDNVEVEMDASEPPILDGSSKGYVNMILEGEIVEQDADRQYFELDQPISVSKGNSSLIALPYDGFKISCTSADDRGIHTQHLSIEIDPDVFATQIAAARTFTVYEDIEELLKLGKIKGGSLENAIVLKDDKIMSKEPLRFEDELVRHKILDVIGDVLLLGKPLKAHIVAVRPGHAINAELTAKLAQRMEDLAKGEKKPAEKPKAARIEEETQLDIRRVIETLPHRYPFLMIDRVTEFRGEDELTAIKNVTINEPFFQGHYPGQPIMPGVLQIEAMAQAAGILMLRKINQEGKTAVFMSVDKVKWRQKVVPGDQLRIDIKLLKVMRGKIGTAAATCYVGDKVASSGELKFMILDEGEDV